MNKKKLLMMFLIGTMLTGCTTKQNSTSTNNTVYRNADPLSKNFDTTYAYQEAPETDQSEANYNFTINDLAEYNNLYDIYNNYDGLNNLKTINDNAGIEPVKVDQKIIDLLREAKSFYTLSDGEFDITMGAVLNVWHKYREDAINSVGPDTPAPIPSQAEIDAVKDDKGWDKVIIDEDNSTVYITDPNVSLDVGGIAKGYATEQVAKDVMARGASGGYVNVGRNIRTTGNKLDGSAWRIGIADPANKNPNGVLAIDAYGATSFVTSGDYERYFTGLDGSRYCHILDPSTLYPATLYRSVTIQTVDSGAADCLSTTLFTMSVEDGKKVLQKYTEETGKEAEAVWVMDTDKKQEDEHGKETNGYYVTYTDGLEDRITWF